MKSSIPKRYANHAVESPLELKIERRPIDQLRPNDANPRTHTQDQIAQIAASIREFGFVNPILISGDGTIIAGEGRFRAAKGAGLSDIPVIVLSHLSETQRRALVIADNQLALNAGWDEETLRQQLVALRDEEFDLDLLGFDQQELAERLAAERRAGVADEDELAVVPGDPVGV